MITKTKTKDLNLFYIKSSDINKQILMRMAKEGKDKPHYKTKLGIALGSYIAESSNCYDIDFSKNIKKQRPDWFKIKIKHNVEQNKQTLIEMAKSGKAKPSKKTKLGNAFKSYTKEYSKCYDVNFSNIIKKHRSDWFLPRSYRSTKNKQTLIEMAKSGKAKPKFKSKWFKKLKIYTQKTSASYDVNFFKELKKYRPDWFKKVKCNSTANKQKLISMAKSGKARPSQKTKIGMALCKYTKRDVSFNNIIRKLRPDWFLSLSQISSQKKQTLIMMAKNGENKPHYKTKIGMALGNYTNKSSMAFDIVFNKKIRSLRKDWFKTKRFK